MVSGQKLPYCSSDFDTSHFVVITTGYGFDLCIGVEDQHSWAEHCIERVLHLESLRLSQTYPNSEDFALS